MTALDLINGLTQAIFVLIFLLVFVRTLRHTTPAHIDMSLFFGILAFVVAESRISGFLGVTPPVWFTDVLVALIVALPYVLLRLVDDFTRVPVLLKRGAELFLIILVAAYAYDSLVTPPVDPPIILAVVAYLAGLFFYCGAAFIAASRKAEGVTRRRMQGISLGTILFGLDILMSGIGGVMPEPDKTFLTATGQILGLASGVAFYLGFAPPSFLRRAWQAPELRNFLARAAELPRLPDTLDIVRELERGAAGATGSNARVALWDEDTKVLRMWREGGEAVEVMPGRFIAGRAFELQRTVFTTDPSKEDPADAESYRRSRAGAVMSTPITAGGRRLGVLSLFAERPPIFAQSDMELAQLLADQAAVILESRALIDHAARMKAQEEAMRLKEDFVSAAAHDLKTPLTTVVAQAEFLERKALRDPSSPADLQGLQRIVREGKRLAALVTDLLDAARLEQGRLTAEREPVDLGTLVSEVVARQQPAAHATDVDVRGAVVGVYDRRRIEQLVENLVENAKKYSPEATPVQVTVWQQDGEARVSVRDHGIGIPPTDLPKIFERFSRASNVDDRRFHGMGLGLYICRGIVEEHGGRIWAESEIGKGSTFHVALPLQDGRRLN
ncbi:MAG TPA: ATP-binding protein [Candidatus Acidoferrales bacterium]|nr:ATP-binding protein [Candidatus Acidoferrales bacterium]